MLTLVDTGSSSAGPAVVVIRISTRYGSRLEMHMREMRRFGCFGTVLLVSVMGCSNGSNDAEGTAGGD
ncbi:MAG TPA: hypothetical protein VIV60_26045, partial [Polyangiaceae bacterium]